MKQELNKRLEKLGWTLYKLAKEFSKLREQKGVKPTITPNQAIRYHSAIGKAMENPANSKLETIQDIVRVLGGELYIVWQSKECLEPEKQLSIKVVERKNSSPNIFGEQQYTVKFQASGTLYALIYYSSFLDALRSALDHQFYNPKATAQIYLAECFVCDVSDILQICLSVQQFQQAEQSSTDYVVINYTPAHHFF